MALAPLCAPSLAATRAAALVLQDNGPQIVPFNTTWHGALPGSEIRTYSIIGYEPPVEEGAGRPVYIFAGGFGAAVTENHQNMRFAREMAMRGFIAAVIEIPGALLLQRYPDRDDRDAREEVPSRCEGDRGSLVASKITFSYSGVGDNSGSALATLCRRGRADCAAGIALHGVSLGGLLVGSASRYAHGLSATLIWAAGAFAPGWATCCGRTSGLTTCCDRSAGGVVGGTPLECMHSDADSARDPAAAASNAPFRRYAIGADDVLYGNCNDEWTGNNEPHNCSFDRSGRSPGAVEQCRIMSDRDCGEGARSCIDPDDGSGYYVPIEAEIGSEHDSHEFHNGGGDDGGLNPRFVGSEAPWGLGPSMDWLQERVVSRQGR